MIDAILVETNLLETRIALTREGALEELLIVWEDEASLVDDIFLGHVARVVSGLDAAFVEIGDGVTGFLAGREAQPRARDGERLPIEACVHEGAKVLVQVTRDAEGDKGARITTNLTLPGRLLVFTPTQEGIAFSRRLEDDAERARLTAAIDGHAEAEEGFVVRTAAEGASAEELGTEIEGLRRTWSEIEAGRDQAAKTGRLHRASDPLGQLLREYGGPELRAIHFDDAETLARAKALDREAGLGLGERFHHHAGPAPLFELHGIAEQADEILLPEVELPSGGYLVVEETEAFTAIDVNTAGAGEGRGRGAMLVKVNIEAAETAAREIRLRGLGGLIVIDFVQMRSAEDEGRVMAALKGAFAGDKTPARIAGLTRFGLGEIARKRARKPLSAFLTEPCDSCGAQHHLPGRRAMAAKLLRRASAAAGRAGPGVLHSRAAPAVIDWLEHAPAFDPAAFAQSLGREMVLESDAALTRDQLEVRLDTAAPA